MLFSDPVALFFIVILLIIYSRNATFSWSHPHHLPINDSCDPNLILNKGSTMLPCIFRGSFCTEARCAGNSWNQPSIRHTIKPYVPLRALIAFYQQYHLCSGWPGLKTLTGVRSIEDGQPGLVVKQLARCFPSPLGRAVLGLNSAAWGELPATGLQGAALRLSTEW